MIKYFYKQWDKWKLINIYELFFSGDVYNFSLPSTVKLYFWDHTKDSLSLYQMLTLNPSLSNMCHNAIKIYQAHKIKI